jgi:molecular chaperone Hsp33
MRDTLQKFIFEHYGIRGSLVHLGRAYQSILDCHPYPTTVQQPLGQLLAAAALLAATIKFEGSLIIQTQTDGDIKQLVAQCNNQYHIRGLALWNEESEAESLTIGQGHLAITMIPTDGSDRYQGVVALEAAHLNQCIQQYFEQSEQLPTRLWLFANEECAAGLLLQKMPDSKPEDYPQWENACILAETITAQELLYLDNETILHRLFHEEDVRLFRANPVSFQCSCSIPKMEQAIVNLGYEDAKELLLTHKTILITCEFCNRHYEFDKVDIEKIFRA